MVLYHASQQKDLAIIQPKRTLSRDKYIGDFIFATPHKTLALMYLVPKGFATLMNYDKNPPSIVICAAKDELARRDTGGAIYELSPENFKQSPQVELRQDEMASRQPEKPKSSEVYGSALDALSSHGITIEFTDQAGFEKLLRKKPSAS
jgi:hypothetical protein